MNEEEKRQIHNLVETCLKNNVAKSLPAILEMFLRESGIGSERDEATPVHFVIHKP